LKSVVTVFGSSRPRRTEADYTTAFELGRSLARAGYVVCNGGYGGTMEASARGARDAGGHTIGITCSAFGRQAPNPWIVEVEEHPTLIERMTALIARGEAYVILKGGTGTLLEFAAVWELMNKSMITERPVLVLGDFWESVLTTVSQELEPELAKTITRVPTVEECVRTIDENLRRHDER
jgi:uncharacterized protein (TIGR00725 family)